MARLGVLALAALVLGCAALGGRGPAPAPLQPPAATAAPYATAAEDVPEDDLIFAPLVEALLSRLQHPVGASAKGKP